MPFQGTLRDQGLYVVDSGDDLSSSPSQWMALVFSYWAGKDRIPFQHQMGDSLILDAAVDELALHFWRTIADGRQKDIPAAPRQ